MPEFSPLIASSLAAALMCGILLFALAKLGRFALFQEGGAPEDKLSKLSAEALFRLDRGRVMPLNAAADALFDQTNDPSLKLEGFIHKLGIEDAPPLLTALANLGASGKAFRLNAETREGAHLSVRGFTSGRYALFATLDITAWRGAEQIAAQDLARLRDEHAVQAEALNTSPILIWRHHKDGTLDWTNAGVDLRRTRQISSIMAQLRESKSLLSDGGSTRVAVASTEGAQRHWFDVSLQSDRLGGQLYQANAIDGVVQAEQALARFVETLTETFAHLPTGLAIFDRDRTLGLFNPALCDHLNLDPAWLASRPSLFSFFDRLREARMIPEQKDYADWRDQFGAFEAQAEGNSYDASWTLPEGRTLRVSGRAHPHGAIAFLFDDVTQSLSHQHRFKDDIALREAAFSRLAGAHIAFDAGGRIMFHSDAADLPGDPSLNAVIEHWQTAYGESATWTALRGYVLKALPDRVPLRQTLIMADGQEQILEAVPLPLGATLISFLPPKAAAKRLSRAMSPEGLLTQTLVSDALRLCSDAGVALTVSPLDYTLPTSALPEHFRTLMSTVLTAVLAQMKPAGTLRLSLQMTDHPSIRLSGISAQSVLEVAEVAQGTALSRLLFETGCALRASAQGDALELVLPGADSSRQDAVSTIAAQ